MTNAAIDIPNLLYTYADLFDAGDFAGAARLFDHGALMAGNTEIRGEDAIVAMWNKTVHLYADGTPRTRHLTTNPRIALSDDGLSAQCWSQWTVLQATDTLPLQIVATGRYHDRLAIINGAWRFLERRYLQIDFMGDVSAHLQMPKPAGDV
ncbi:nuclear transport factor 2 family protein [Brevundimonas terrae]|uniref:Nuclear transport factor 2 family protein n=1 Tax=Brevundimonas terrae TaxID=363631 RepID=A0ABN0Y6V3_9CAUL|nr:nuclear transport factor 2 family protein [Brevundimonas terrae]NIJ25406.1 3-phenylpropionate/cinnamic acid dioxygenase small subunit [Brevundimonas terrae]